MAGGEERRLEQRLQEPGPRVVVVAFAVGFRHQRVFRVHLVPEVPFADEPLGDRRGLRLVAGELEGGQREERVRHHEDQDAGLHRPRHVGETAAHPADPFKSNVRYRRPLLGPDAPKCSCHLHRGALPRAGGPASVRREVLELARRPRRCLDRDAFRRPAIQVPGRSATTAVILGALTIAATIWCLRSPEHRPPLGGLLAARAGGDPRPRPVPGRGPAGHLGTGFSNDMAPHMAWAEAILSKTAADVRPLPPDYPLGPHALVATIAKGLGLGIDQRVRRMDDGAAAPQCLDGSGLLRRASWAGRLVAATVVGHPIPDRRLLRAGGLQGGGAGGPGARHGPAAQRLRPGPWAADAGFRSPCSPAGLLSVYSAPGLPWPVVLLGVVAARPGLAARLQAAE